MKTYNIELTAEQLIELNDLLVHDLDIDPCFVTDGIINQVRDIVQDLRCYMGYYGYR